MPLVSTPDNVKHTQYKYPQNQSLTPGQYWLLEDEELTHLDRQSMQGEGQGFESRNDSLALELPLINRQAGISLIEPEKERVRTFISK